MHGPVRYRGTGFRAALGPSLLPQPHGFEGFEAGLEEGGE